MIIPPSYRADRLRPWGSDPRTDPLYSSSRMRIVHPPTSEGRVERVARIAENPVTRRYLRVCYENRRPAGNCSRCEKCLSTMATLAGLGLLSSYPVFDSSPSLADRLDALPGITHHADAVWREIAALGHPPSVSAALERLLQRGTPDGPSPRRRELRRPLWGWRRGLRGAGTGRSEN
jgi:hypothetical protein